jgi:hypothetical protein
MDVVYPAGALQRYVPSWRGDGFRRLARVDVRAVNPSLPMLSVCSSVRWRASRLHAASTVQGGSGAVVESVDAGHDADPVDAA